MYNTEIHPHTHTSTPVHIYTSTHHFLTSSCLKVIGSCCLLSLSLFLFSLLSLANKISRALIYSQASWTFLWAPWPPVSSSSCPPLLHPSFPQKWTMQHPYSHATQKAQFLSLMTVFFSNWDNSCPLISFGLLWKAMWLNGFSFEGNERPDCRYQSG